MKIIPTLDFKYYLILLKHLISPHFVYQRTEERQFLLTYNLFNRKLNIIQFYLYVGYLTCILYNQKLENNNNNNMYN